MVTLNIHRCENIKYAKYCETWFVKFFEYLSNFFKINYINYCNKDNQTASQINLLSSTHSPFFFNPVITDVDCIIENAINGEFIVLSFTEYFNSYVVHLLKSDKCKKILLAHYPTLSTYDMLKRDGLTHKIEKISPWFFGWSQDYDYKKFRNIREQCTRLNGIFYKASGIQAYRQTILEVSKQINLDLNIVNHETYMLEMAKSKLGISFYMDLEKDHNMFSHPGEFCYRDMEYMSIGLPFVRIEYKDSLINGLIPNKHYIAIPRERVYVEHSKNGNLGVATMLVQKINDVIQDDSFLNYISKNAMEWYDKHCTWPNSAELTINLTGIQEWKI